MMAYEELKQAIAQIADPKTAESWDNDGIQLDVGKAECHTVLVALEVSGDVIEEAARLKADFIVSHHPLLFDPIRKIDAKETPGRYIVELIRHGISVYAVHTSFDKAERGINAYLAEQLGLLNIRPFQHNVCQSAAEPKNWMGLSGVFPQAVALREAQALVECALGLPPKAARAVGDPQRKIKNVGLCGGAGSSLIELARANDCELFITGDIKYHEARKAKEAQFCLIDAGHYGTERFFAKHFARQLAEKTAGEIKVIESSVKLDPFF